MGCRSPSSVSFASYLSRLRLAAVTGGAFDLYKDELAWHYLARTVLLGYPSPSVSESLALSYTLSPSIYRSVQLRVSANRTFDVVEVKHENFKQENGARNDLKLFLCVVSAISS